jgi:hypothetical protein
VPSVDGAAIQPPSSRRVRPRPQHVAVIDAICAQRHRVDQRHDLAPSVAGAGVIGAQAHEALRERLDPQPLSERHDEHDPGVGDHPLVIEGDLHSIQSDQPVIVHHEGDLLRGPRMPTHPRKALLRRSFFLQHRTTPPRTVADRG